MKIGVRKPSIKKSISARTTGRAKRAVKSSINPLYGKKGMGWINDPEKAMYNKIYNKTTIGINDAIKDSTSYSNVDIDNISHGDEMGAGEFIVTILKLLFAIFQIIFWGAIVIGILYFLITIIF